MRNGRGEAEIGRETERNVYTHVHAYANACGGRDMKGGRGGEGVGRENRAPVAAGRLRSGQGGEGGGAGMDR